MARKLTAGATSGSMDEELNVQDRLHLVRSIARTALEYKLPSIEINKVVELMMLISTEPDERAEPTIAIDRIGRLTSTLERTFPVDHPVWEFVRWKRVDVDA